MKLGAFSISLSVKDLEVSRKFYANLGFEIFAGDAEKNYYILKNGDTLIGIFQGMFENNILTFNPGWNQDAQKLDHFDDVRNIQQHLKEKGVEIHKEANDQTTGPESIILMDPDGNSILIDQHV